MKHDRKGGHVIRTVEGERGFRGLSKGQVQ